MLIHYRQLHLPDLALLQRLGRDTYAPYYAQVWQPGGLDGYMDLCFGPKTLPPMLLAPNIEYWLASAPSEEPVGIIKLVLDAPPPADCSATSENALYLEKIYLLPDYLGLGAGQQMMEFVKTRAILLKKNAIWLQVMQTGPVAAYEKAGFQKVGTVYWNFEALIEEHRSGWVMWQELH